MIILNFHHTTFVQSPITFSHIDFVQICVNNIRQIFVNVELPELNFV
jgi:hypothetical protein